MAKDAWVEAVDWLVFSAGGFIAAFLIPVHIIATNLGGALGLGGIVHYDVLAAKLADPLIKLYLFIVLGGTSWFTMHRIRFVVMDLGLVKYRRQITALSFALLAIIITIIAYAVLGF